MNPDEHHSRLYYKKLLPASAWRRILASQQQEIYDRFIEHFPAAAETTVLNVGVNADLREHHQYFLESRYPYLEKVVACGLESDDYYGSLFPAATYKQVFSRPTTTVRGRQLRPGILQRRRRARRLTQRSVSLCEDVLRVAKRAFFTTPNRWYPIDLHTLLPLLHYLPGRLYRPLYRLLGFEFFSREQNLNLLDRSSLASLVPRERPFEIRTHKFLGLPSNLLLSVNR